MGDLISREALMRFPIRWDHYDKKNGSEEFVAGIETVLEYAANLPSVDAEPVRRGEWVDGQSISGAPWNVCSRCGGYAHTPKGGDKYCHHCGAKMKEEK